jgi:hypothetical protein
METNAKYENVTLPFSVYIHQRTPFNSGYPVYYQDSTHLPKNSKAAYT